MPRHVINPGSRTNQTEMELSHFDRLLMLLLQYNNLLANMETKYSVAEVCREDGTCLPLDPGRSNPNTLTPRHPDTLTLVDWIII